MLVSMTLINVLHLATVSLEKALDLDVSWEGRVKEPAMFLQIRSRVKQIQQLPLDRHPQQQRCRHRQ
jgi:hypothetical protein